MRALVFALLLFMAPATASAQEAPYDGPLPGTDAATDAAPQVTVPAPTPEVPDGPDPGWLRGRSGRLRRPITPPAARPPRAPLLTGPRWVFLVMDGGPTYERLYGFPMVGGEVTAGLDLELRGGIGIILGPTFQYGELDGLRLLHGHFDGLCFVRVERFRIGAGFGFGLLSLSSVTADPPATSGTLELTFLLSVDLFTFGEDRNKSAFYVGGKLRGSLIVAGDASPFLWGPAAVLGFRL
jgi:hypothetical protein